MQPIFQEQINMWKDFGFDIPIIEGTYWLDNGIIKAFTPDGELHKLYKYKVLDDLSISITEHKDFKDTIKPCFSHDNFETWEETYQRLKSELQIKIDESLEVIRQTVEDYSDYDKYILTSTGKDSMITLDLVHKIAPDISVVFNNTSLDCADTYRMVKSHIDWISNNPVEGFYTWIEKYNFIPQRMARSCCSVFKEGNGDKYFEEKNIKKLLTFMGIRNDESNARANREYITHSPKWGDKDWYGCLPIRKWTDLDVWLYTLHFNIEINPKYKKGYSRCGCAIACPFATKNTWVLDKYWYPKMRARWERILTESFIKNNRWTRMNCTKDEYLMCWNGGLLRPEPTEEVIQEFMQYKGLTDRNVALQYFNKTCCECSKNVRQNDVLAMNLKMFGRTTDKIYCKKCLMKELNMTKEEWDNNVADFKAQGCTLF